MSRRAVIVRVHPSVLEKMMFASLPGMWFRTDRGLPEGAKCVGRGFDWERNVFWFTFEYESFAEVPAGAPIPPFDNIRLSVVHFISPIDVPQVAMLERLTAEQVARAESLLGDTQPSAVVGG
jgi:hypothetical protein